MCGIAGFFGKGNYDDGMRMIQKIRHRGPDYQGVIHKENICLAHARLSIIDLSSSANQPMFSYSENSCIVFNGEIYNYLELKKELLNAGKYQFHTTSDTEVLLYLYEEYGIKLLDKINGMFAFAIYDFRKKELFLAKDRMGKKPLYYSHAKDGTFVFASELKSVIQHPSIAKEINYEALNQYLTFDYVPTPNSIFKNIFKLEPSSYLIVKNGSISQKNQYWQHSFNTNFSVSFQDAKRELDQLLNKATASRLMSDVPLGVFLSGGLDSSTIAYYAQKNSSQKIKTFTIGFQDKSYNETDYAQEVSAYLGTEHHCSILTPQKTIELIEKIYPMVDEPFADASLIPTYYLSKFTREKVTVALGGDGSDELLTGYPTFIADKFKTPLQYFPKTFINGLLSLTNLLPANDKNISFDFKLKQYLRGFTSTKNHTHQLWLGSFLPAEKKKLFKPEIYHALQDKSGLDIIDRHFEKTIGTNEFYKIIYYYYHTYLLDDILVKVDRASMYNSLEVRAPFLDKNVVEFLNTLPKSFKQKGLNGKYILKQLMKDKLPGNIIHRPKKGFGIPLSDWIRNDLKKPIEEILLTDNEYFNKKYIAQIFNEHNTKKANHRKLIWNLYMFRMWGNS